MEAFKMDGLCLVLDHQHFLLYSLPACTEDGDHSQGQDSRVRSEPFAGE